MAELPPPLEILNALGKIVQSSKDNFQTVFESTFWDPEELRAAIHQNLENVQQNTDALTEQMSKVLENIESCPQLKTLFHSLRTQFDLFLSKIITKFDESVTDADPQTALSAVQVAMVPDIPYYIELIRDLLIYWVDVYVTDNCEEIANLIYTRLDPTGKIANTLVTTLSLPGSQATDLLINIIGSLLPGDGEGDLDYFHIVFQLLCAPVQPGIDFNERTGGNCPQEPETSDYIHVIYSIICRIADLVNIDLLPTENVIFCFSH